MEQQSPLAQHRSNKPPDFAAFISHAKADHKRVQEIVGALEQRGFKCWVAPRDVRPGHSYGDEIIRGIERSRCFILALSKASNESPFVAREVERAISKRKPIFPVRIEDVEPSSALELFISSTQWIDAFSDGDSQIDRLADLLAGEGAEGAQTVATPAPVSPARSRGWVWPAVFAIPLLLAGLIGAFLWNSYGKKAESVPQPASAPSTAEPGLAVATPPAAPPSASAESKPRQISQPSSATAPPPAASRSGSAGSQAENPAPAPTELPRPHAPNEDCSRSGDTTLCASSVLAPAQGNIYGPRNLTDGDDKTAWVEGNSGQGLGEFVVLEFRLDAPRKRSDHSQRL